jgi:hypothetical protein
MKTGAAAIAACLCFAAGMVRAAPIDDCLAGNQKALKEVEALHQGAQLPKPEQDRYKSLQDSIMKPIKPKGPGGGPPLANCREKTKQIAELRQALQRIITPQVGDRARGGIVFHVTDGGKHGLVAQAQDIYQNFDGRMWWGAAVDMCERSTEGGYSDWFLPSTEELGILFGQRALVGGFKTGNYWSSTKLTYGPMKDWDGQVYFLSFETGSSMWSDTRKEGPNRSLHHGRAIRKY